eukprot:CAMPEP_0170455380 /NCGR_PEP_ID=MMETSP0123-20130129/3365_1 /TAXON_ID=182087 /ORGANISM="Favella ehrenbergii, Strain Fehren 1" /LENGTH=58 /DNA_ID=CAMNT_0010718501 /DNA_START=510 /DNA_END=686 /DNA_ORIENTATION=-
MLFRAKIDRKSSGSFSLSVNIRMISFNISKSESPEKSADPVTSSTKMQPMAQTSTAWV